MRKTIFSLNHSRIYVSDEMHVINNKELVNIVQKKKYHYHLKRKVSYKNLKKN